jgi:hypothetical protein
MASGAEPSGILCGVLAIDETSGKPKDLIRDILDLAAIVIAIGLIGLVVAGAAGLPRILLALAFAFFVPGRAIVTNWPRLGYWSEFGMPVVISLTVLTLAATATLWAHVWHPVGLFEIEAGLCVVALPVGMSRRHGRADLDIDEPTQPPGSEDSDTGPKERVVAEPPSAPSAPLAPSAASEPPSDVAGDEPAVAGEAELGGVDLVHEQGQRPGDDEHAGPPEVSADSAEGAGTDGGQAPDGAVAGR